MEDATALVQSAVQLFAKNGYRKTTIDDIARHAEVAKPTVYQYVKSKSDLLEAAFGTVLKDREDGAGWIAQISDRRQQLAALVQGFVTSVVELRPYHQIFFGEERELPRRVQRRFRLWSGRIDRQVVDVIVAAGREGVVRPDVDPALAARLIVGMINSIYRWHDPRGPWSADDIADQVIRMLQGYILPAVSSPGGDDPERDHPPLARRVPERSRNLAH